MPTTHSYFSCHLASMFACTTVRRFFTPMFGNKRKIRRWDARPRYCTATCCTPRALPHHNKLWFIKYYDFCKKYSPGCAFPPQAARRRHNPVKYNTKTTYHVWNDDFWQRYCVMAKGGKQLRSLCWVRSAPSLSRDTGAAFPYSLPGMRSRTAAFFSIIYLRRKSRFFLFWQRVIMPECIYS